MLWPRCSKTGSRRNRGRLLVVVLLAVVAGLAPAQIEHSAEFEITNDSLVIDIRVAGAEVDQLFSVLQDGMTARLEYRIRVSQPRDRPFRLFGDRLIREFRPAYEARWDAFSGAYELVGHDGSRHRYEDEATLYAHMFALEEYRIPWTTVTPDPGLVVEISTQYTPIVFVPGLSILTLFTTNRSEQSPWSRHVIVPEAEQG